VLPKRRCVLASVQSDSHTWNLVYMGLLLEEHGFEVLNLGCCTTPLEISGAVVRSHVDLIVISTINGHGAAQALDLIAQLRSGLGARLPPCVIGGRLTTRAAGDRRAARALESAGFAHAFVGDGSIKRLREYLGAPEAARRAGAGGH
jgi:methylaspartate mutase sigma subunit